MAYQNEARDQVRSIELWEMENLRSALAPLPTFANDFSLLNSIIKSLARKQLVYSSSRGRLLSRLPSPRRNSSLQAKIASFNCRWPINFLRSSAPLFNEEKYERLICISFLDVGDGRLIPLYASRDVVIDSRLTSSIETPMCRASLSLSLSPRARLQVHVFPLTI